MIDFRYHLVSLISVFLALAVGVVLGAGPLQNSLGNALTNQVTSLRQDRNATHAQLEQTEAAVNDRDSYIEAAGAALLPSALEGRKVALVVMPEATSDDVDALSSSLESAGAQVVGQVALTTAWADPARETFRSTYSGQFAGYMDAPSSAAGNTVLGMGLATALQGTDDNAQALSDLLTASDTPLMTKDADLADAADSVIVIGPRTPATKDEAASPTPGKDTGQAWADAMSGLASVVPTVVVGAADAHTDLVAQLRSAQASVTTVDGVGQATAKVSAPLALADVIAHGTQAKTAAYGFEEGADAVMPPAPAAKASQGKEDQ